VDVNQGWTNRDEAARLCEFLHSKNCLFVEQPMPVDQSDDMAWLKENTALPIIADESVITIDGLKDASHFCDGVNIKLMKCGGLAAANEMLVAARKQGLKTVLGAMAESSCGNTAAAHLSPLADWVDLDGPTLITNDPFRGISYQNGKILLPKEPGSGVELIQAMGRV
jgi:L-alanine-DL-glutamate epimerase-like enolase superfamily enzyme